MSTMNLDRLAAIAAQSIIANPATSDKTKLENLATKALGVLQENGVYAAMLFLYSRKREKDHAKVIAEEFLNTLQSAELAPLDLAFPADMDRSNWLEVSEYLNSSLCETLDTLLLIKQIWEQTLIYTRFGAKARG